MEKLQKNLEKYNLGKWFKKDNLIILILAGLLLVVINLPTEKEQNSENEVAGNMQKSIEGESIVSTSYGTKKYDDLYEYAEYLEEKLERALTNMKGVGKISVMITLETSEEQVVEKDEPIVRNNTAETDNSGGSRNVYQMDSGQETVYEKQGNNEIPYVSKTILPQISGVLIVAEGVGTGNTSKDIAEIAQALFDVEAHKVKVVAME